MMWFSLADQTVYFLSSIALGAALAVLYDLVRAGRMLFRAGRVHMLICDVIFFALCGVLTSLFALPFNKGSVRAFIVIGEGIGFLTYRMTIGSIFGKFYAFLARVLRQFIRKNCEFLKNFFDLLLQAGALLLYNVNVLLDRFIRFVGRGLRELFPHRERKPIRVRESKQNVSPPCPTQERPAEKQKHKSKKKKERSHERYKHKAQER
jgi:hypothetical protein